MCDQQSLRSACAYAQSDQNLCYSLEYSMSVKLLTQHNLESPNLKEGCTGSSESTLVKMPHCWKSHVMALFIFARPVRVRMQIIHQGVLFSHQCILQRAVWTAIEKQINPLVRSNWTPWSNCISIWGPCQYL